MNKKLDFGSFEIEKKMQTFDEKILEEMQIEMCTLSFLVFYNVGL